MGACSAEGQAARPDPPTDGSGSEVGDMIRRRPRSDAYTNFRVAGVWILSTQFFSTNMGQHRRF